MSIREQLRAERAARRRRLAAWRRTPADRRRLADLLIESLALDLRGVLDHFDSLMNRSPDDADPLPPHAALAVDGAVAAATVTAAPEAFELLVRRANGLGRPSLFVGAAETLARVAGTGVLPCRLSLFDPALRAAIAPDAGAPPVARAAAVWLDVLVSGAPAAWLEPLVRDGLMEPAVGRLPRVAIAALAAARAARPAAPGAGSIAVEAPPAAFVAAWHRWLAADTGPASSHAAAAGTELTIH